MTKQQMLNKSNDKVKRARLKDIALGIAFCTFVVVPLVWYVTDHFLAK